MIIYPTANPNLSAFCHCRFPYMSCEVICCEVPELLTKLVEDRDGLWLDRLFDFLQQSEDLDCYLAGYFEKILEMLFRKMTSQMMVYLNRKGLPLFRQFLCHIRNYSIMQIVQRLMLPHLPFTNPDADMLNFEDSKEVEQCNWSFLPEACEDLLRVMLQPNQVDEPLHVSDMLITVVQLSPPETLLIKFLCQADSIRALLLAATSDVDATDNDDGSSLGDSPQLRSQVSLAAASVLESLVSRLFESGFPMMMASALDSDLPEHGQLQEAEQEALNQVHELLRSICDEVAPLLDRLSALLLRLLQRAQRVRHSLAQHDAVSSNEAVSLQAKMRLPRLGHLGLQAVKLVEALVRVGSFKIDAACRDTGLLAVCLRLFLAFDFHSVLHLSVQRIFVTVFEAPVARAELQAHLCRDCGLLEVLMARVGLDLLPREVTSSIAAGDLAASADVRFALPEVRELISDHQEFKFSARHSSPAGHLVLIAHAAFLLLAGRDPIADEDFDGDDLQAGDAHDASQQHEDQANKHERLQRAVHLRKLLASREGAADDAMDLTPQSDDELASCALLRRWDDFVERRFKKVLEHQLLSGPLADGQSTAPSSANTSADHSLSHHTNLAQTMLLSLGAGGVGGVMGDDVVFEERFEDEDFDADHAHIDHDLPSHFHGHGGNPGGSHYQQHLSQFAMTHSEVVGHAADADFRPFDDAEDTDVDHRVHPHQPQLDFSAFDRRATVEDAVVFAEEDDIASHFSHDDPFADDASSTPATDFELPDPPMAPTVEATFGSFDAFADFDNFGATATSADGTTLPPPPPVEADL